MQSMDIDCKVSYVPVNETGYFSNLVTDYLNGDDKLKNFYSFALTDDGLTSAIAERKKFPANRSLLVEVIKEQYEGLATSEKLEHNLELLKSDNTFTVCSAHQPNLMTGYLYFIYKIVHSVKLAEHLKTLSPKNNFVPVFYIGSEDNDLEELGHFRYANQVFNWDTAQQGAVGMMKVDRPLEKLLKKLMLLLGPMGHNEKELKSIIKRAYAPGNTIAQATRILINELLGFLGVLVIDANEVRLKNSFSDIIKQEILHPKAFELVNASSQQLQSHYKVQAFYRPINFFYLKEGLRERIELVNGNYLVLNTDLNFSMAEMEQEIEQHPERFSPNVILRGMYQESILPNIAFIGGGSEVAYWMQLRNVFNHYNVFYPAVVLRQSAVVLEQKTVENQNRIGLSDVKMFQKTQSLIDELVENEKTDQWNLDAYKNELNTWKSEWLTKYAKLDKNLKNSVQAIMQKFKHQMDVMDKKINRAIKVNLDIEIERIYSFKTHAFPKDSLQERYDTFLPFYLNYGTQFFETLHQNTDPFGKQFLILKYS